MSRMSSFFSSSSRARPPSGDGTDHLPTSSHAAAPTLANQAQRRTQDSRQPQPQAERDQMISSMDKVFSELAELRRKYNDSQDEVAHVRNQKDAKILDLTTTLNETRNKLKIVQEQHFRSQEKSQAVDDSLITGMVEQISQTIKNIVQVLLRNANASAVREALFKNAIFQEFMGSTMRDRISIKELEVLLDNSTNPLHILKLLIRAAIFAMIRSTFFNQNMFFGINPGLRDVYLSLLNPGSDMDTAPASAKKDASLWRSQTLTTIDKNAERMNVSDRRELERKTLFNKIIQLLDPLSSLNSNSESKDEDVNALVEYAASVSITLGKQRALFEMQIGRHIGKQPQPELMYSIPTEATHGDEEEGGVPMSTPHVVVAVITPVLIKHGNADGEQYDTLKVITNADVLVVDAENWSNISRIATGGAAKPKETVAGTSNIDKSKAGTTRETAQEVSNTTDNRRKSADHSMLHREEGDPGESKLQRAATYAAVSPIDSPEGHGPPSSIDSTASKVSSLAHSDITGPVTDKIIPADDQKVLLDAQLAQARSEKGPSQSTSSNGKSTAQS